MHPNRSLRALSRLALAGLLLTALTLGGCPPTTPPDDSGAGDGSGSNTGGTGGTGAGGSQLGNGNNTGSNGPPKPGGGGGGENPAGAPVIADIPDGAINTGQPYTGPTPTITANAGAIIWTLVSGPPELSIASDSGIVRWDRAYTGTFNIQIKATGPSGSTVESWNLVVAANSNLPLSQTRFGDAADGRSRAPSLSADGRFVAFVSEATNLVANDTNALQDVFVLDRNSGVVERVSVAPGGGDANGASCLPVQANEREPISPSISGDGRYIVFGSNASNLVAGDTNGQKDVFLFDRQTATTTRVSVDPNGNQIAGNSERAAISQDGRFVVYESDSGAPVTNDHNGKRDIFLRDLQAGANELVSVDSGGNQFAQDSIKASVSADGRYVCFITFTDDGHTQSIVYLRDRQTGRSSRMNLRSDGSAVNGTCTLAQVSADGAYVVFTTSAVLADAKDPARLDVFLANRDSGAITMLSKAFGGASGGNKDPLALAISGDGSIVAITTDATNLMASDTNLNPDVFVYSRATGRLTLASRNIDGLQANGASLNAAVSADGRLLAFESRGTDIALSDTNGVEDIFARPLP